MKSITLPEDALWRLVRSLSSGERRLIQRRVRGTRLMWLFRTLLSMKEWSREKLRLAYQRTFPNASGRLLRVYKQQLWQVIWTELLSTDPPGVAEEIRLWRRLWAAILLWQRRETDLAQVIWYQAFTQALTHGNYEIALYSLRLLELFSKDLHFLDTNPPFAEYSHRLTTLLYERYHALSEKLNAVQHYHRFLQSHILALSSLPTQDPWALYFQAYAEMIRAADENNFAEALRAVLKMWKALPAETSLHTDYHRRLTLLNVGILLLNYRAGYMYERWWAAWQASLTPHSANFPFLREIALATRLVFLFQRHAWQEALSFFEQHRAILEPFIFGYTPNLSYQLTLGVEVLFLFLYANCSPREIGQWRLRLEAWMERYNITHGLEYLWYAFAGWYQAFKKRDKQWMRHWFRRLYQAWKAQKKDFLYWQPFLRLLSGITTGNQRRTQKYLAILLRHEDIQRWEYNRVFFPVQQFLQSLLDGTPLEKYPPITDCFQELPSDVEASLSDLLNSLIRKRADNK